MKEVNAKDGTITFDDETGREWTLPVTGGNVKLQWKPDFGARWAALDVDFEMYGKDHSTNTPIYDGICEVLGGKKPNHFTYELFLDDVGQKISKSKGNGLTIDEWLSYAATESLSYFMYQKPKTAKRLHWDVIPKMVDEYHQQLRAYPAQDVAGQLNNPVYHIHRGQVPESTLTVPFSMLLNLASVSGAEDKAAMWAFINRYAPDASASTHPDLDAAAGFAVRYYTDHVKPNRVFRLPTDTERAALENLRDALQDPKVALAAIAQKNAAMGKDEPLPEADYGNEDFLQSVVFAIGKNHGFEPLRAWFGCLYEVLMGAAEGPRFGGFIALYGRDESIRLIEDGLAGKLAG
jgi:lysyl-tRNA synthetase class 1